MITVEVRLGEALREQIGADATTVKVALDAPATLPDLYRALGLEAAQVALCTVNNRYPDEGQQLEQGDRVRLVAPVAGG